MLLLQAFTSRRDALMKWFRETTFDPDSKGYILYDDVLTIAVLIFSIIYPYMAFFTSEHDIGNICFSCYCALSYRSYQDMII